jgi:hypothetical protein
MNLNTISLMALVRKTNKIAVLKSYQILALDKDHEQASYRNSGPALGSHLMPGPRLVQGPHSQNVPVLGPCPTHNLPRQPLIVSYGKCLTIEEGFQWRWYSAYSVLASLVEGSCAFGLGLSSFFCGEQKRLTSNLQQSRQWRNLWLLAILTTLRSALCCIGSTVNSLLLFLKGVLRKENNNVCFVEVDVCYTCMIGG